MPCYSPVMGRFVPSHDEPLLDAQKQVQHVVGRRSLGALLGAGLLASSGLPSEAAYGNAARVFGGLSYLPLSPDLPVELLPLSRSFL